MIANTDNTLFAAQADEPPAEKTLKDNLDR